VRRNFLGTDLVDHPRLAWAAVRILCFAEISLRQLIDMRIGAVLSDRDDLAKNGNVSIRIVGVGDL
jgi:hypothetical protein